MKLHTFEKDQKIREIKICKPVSNTLILIFCFSPIGNANNFETMEECILNCSGPDNQGEDESKEEIFISPLDSFSSRLHRLKTSFNNRNRGSLKTESPIQGMLFLY